VIFLWSKYRGVIEEGRRRYNGRNYMRDFEYFADETLRYVMANDPNYRLPENLTKYVLDK
jgi:hypothetical protein